jgi:hypothetical protein
MVDDQFAKLERDLIDLRDQVDATIRLAVLALHNSGYTVGPLRETWVAWWLNPSDPDANAALDRELSAMSEAVELRRI